MHARRAAPLFHVGAKSNLFGVNPAVGAALAGGKLFFLSAALAARISFRVVSVVFAQLFHLPAFVVENLLLI